jgi:hypothetical protein
MAHLKGLLLVICYFVCAFRLIGGNSFVVFNGLSMKVKPPLIKGGEIYITMEDLEKMGFALEKKDNGFVIKNKEKALSWRVKMY